MRNRISSPCAAVLAALVSCGAAQADCCHRCGCEAHLKKVCRPVCEIKEVKETEYDCECEDFCIPGRSQVCTEHGVDCNGCPTCEKVTIPACGKVRTRKKLIKKEVVKKVPSYKWVVEYVCDECCHGDCADGCDAGQADGQQEPAEAMPVPPQPAVAPEAEPPPPPPAPMDPETARRASMKQTAARPVSGNHRMQSYFKPPIQ